LKDKEAKAATTLQHLSSRTDAHGPPADHEQELSKKTAETVQEVADLITDTGQTTLPRGRTKSLISS
jgi:hypothetical protein